MKSSSILLPLFCLMMWSCHDEAEIPVLPTEFEGPKVAVGNGHAWTFIITNDILEPQTIGIRFNGPEFSIVDFKDDIAIGDALYWEWCAP